MRSLGARLPAVSSPRLLVTVLPVTAAFLTLGSFGAYRYIDNFWVYRGFAPPRDPAFVSTPGTTERFFVKSAAIGGRSQPVDVYLPPEYAANPLERYPVIYLLHGFPGKPGAFLLTVRLGVDEDVAFAEHRMRPVILVMPFGSSGQFADKEWANGDRPGQGWATFLSRDVVRAVDARFRTIRDGSGRAIAGLSEGGYGAINIALHHPREFGVVESWSGYERADAVPSVFGGDEHLIAENSPLLQVAHVAPAFRREHTFFWFYVGSTDGKATKRQNEAFAAELRHRGIPHWFAVVDGGHTWSVWRANGTNALLAAASHLRRG
jgi:enterochelin esterase-like enzyme